MPPRSEVDRVHEVYATSYRRLVGQLTSVTGDLVEAEDAVMEAFARAVNSGRAFRATDDPEAWLRAVAVNVTRTRWRRGRWLRDVSHRPVAEEVGAPVDTVRARLSRGRAARAELLSETEPDTKPQRTPESEPTERAVQPGFDAVLDRAASSRRRRRTTIASALAAAVVVGGLGAVAGGVLADDGQSPGPDGPAPSTARDGSTAPDERLPSDVRAVLDDDQLQLWSITGAADDAVAALWRGCDFDPCQFAVVTRYGDQVAGEVLGASFPTVTTVPGGWLVEDGRGTFRLSPSGDRAEIFDTGSGSGDVVAGDTAVPTSDGWRLLRGDKLVRIPVPPSGATVIGAYVTPGGRLVAATTSGSEVSVSATNDGRAWELQMASSAAEPATSAVAAGNGNHVAVALVDDDTDGSTRVRGVQVSHDAGLTWSPVRGLDTDGGDRVRDRSSVAVAADGTTYLATASHHLVRIDHEAFAVSTQLSASDSSVFASGDEVCLVAGRGRYGARLCSSDGITGWADQPLPGLG